MHLMPVLQNMLPLCDPFTPLDLCIIASPMVSLKTHSFFSTYIVRHKNFSNDGGGHWIARR